MYASRFLTWVLKVIISLDKANLSLFRMVPAETKKKLVRKTVGLISNPSSTTPLDLDGLLFYPPPGSPTSLISWISSNDPILEQIEQCVRPGMAGAGRLVWTRIYPRRRSRNRETPYKSVG